MLESTGISFRRRHRFSLIRPVRIRVTDNGRVVGNRQDPRDPASRKTVSRTDDRNGEERPARESAHTADWKLMRMRERTRSNCGRRYPSTLVAKVEGGETTQGLGTTRHWWRLWLLAHGYSVCARMCRDQRRRLLSSPRFGTPLADLPLFKIGKVVERGCPSPSLSIPPFDDIDGDRLYSWRPCSISLTPPSSRVALRVASLSSEPTIRWMEFFFFFF